MLVAAKSHKETEVACALREQQERPDVAGYRPNGKWLNWLTDGERSDPGLMVSQRRRKLVEKSFGWMKQDRIRQVRQRGLGRVDWLFRLVAAAHNLLRFEQADSDSGCGLIGE